MHLYIPYIFSLSLSFLMRARKKFGNVHTKAKDFLKKCLTARFFFISGYVRKNKDISFQSCSHFFFSTLLVRHSACQKVWETHFFLTQISSDTGGNDALNASPKSVNSKLLNTTWSSPLSSPCPRRAVD